MNARFGVGRNILQSLGVLKSPEKQSNVHSQCCGNKMVADGGNLVCHSCGTIKKNLVEYSNKPESQKYQFTSTGAIQPGVNTERSDEEKNRALFTEFSNKVANNDAVFDYSIMQRAVNLFREISKGNTKKSENRMQLFAACYYYASIELNNIALEKDIIAIFKLKTEGISSGINMFANRVLIMKKNYDISPRTDPLIFRYFLSKLTFDNRSFLTPENEEFCNKIMQTMIEKNIAYNMEMLANCAGVVFYLIHFRGKIVKKKDITEQLTLKRNIYNRTFNLLITPTVNALLPSECQL